MTPNQAISILRSADRSRVLHAISLVNLTDKEATVLVLHCMRGHTQDNVGREIMAMEAKRFGLKVSNTDQMTPNQIQKIKRKALKKCCEVWEHTFFVKEIQEAAP